VILLPDYVFAIKGYIAGNSSARWKEPWYVGCFAVSDPIVIADSLDIGSLLNPVECSLACAKTG